MQFRVLGPIELVVDGQRVALSSRRQRAVLAALLARPGQIVPVDRLVDAVWGEDPPASAVPSLHSHVSRLRRALAAGALVTETGGYRIVLGPHELDSARFEELGAQARAVAGTEPRRAVTLLDEALGWWRGPAFGDPAVRDCDLVRAAATRLEQLRAAAVADRVDALLALGGHAELIGDLAAAVADDPLAERPHRQLMLARYRSGRPAEALATYRELRHRLREETGLDPSLELQQLHEQMLRQDPDLVAAAGPVRATPAATAPAAATTGLGDIVGRDEDVDTLVSWLATTATAGTTATAATAASAATVTLTGPAGVGKTRLAEEVAARAAGQFPDGMQVCRLAALQEPASVPAAVLGALGIPPRSGPRVGYEALVAALGTRRLLLLLDNCEHLLEPVCRLVTEVRSRCPGVTVLVTSRERLRLPDERVWEVTPLAVPPVGAGVAEVHATPAGALFCARAQAVRSQFTLADHDAAAVAEVCRRLDGMPLAIELAAARVRALAPADLAARLEHRFRLLTAGPAGQDRRHRTLQAAVDWSYELLTDAEARLFDRLSVFAGSFTVDAAERVCADADLPDPDIAGLLAELVDKSMLTTLYAGAQVRYQLLDTMRAYGAQQLATWGATDRFRRAHAYHYVDLAERLAPAVRGADERAAIDQITVEFDNLRLAHAWLVEAGATDLALRLPAALHDYTQYRMRDEITTWTRRALELPRAREQPTFAAALATAARGAVQRGELDRASGNARTALAHAEPDSLPVLWALHVLTEVALYQGKLPEAQRLADQRAELAARLEQDYYRAVAGVSRVLAHLYSGSPAAALGHAANARAAAEACGNYTARAWARYAHGEALLDHDPPRAAELLAQAVDDATLIDSRLTRGVALVSLASLQGRLGNTGRALALFREAVSHWRRIGDHTHQVTTLRNLVELFAAVGADQAAATLHGAVAGAVAGAAPSFGAEADRLDVAWQALVARLGAPRAEAAAEHGRRTAFPQLVDEVLAQLDAPAVTALGDAR